MKTVKDIINQLKKYDQDTPILAILWDQDDIRSIHDDEYNNPLSMDQITEIFNDLESRMMEIMEYAIQILKIQ